MISLSRTDGARKDLLELCTHTPHKGSTIDIYTEFPWEALCGEVAKLKLPRPVIILPPPPDPATAGDAAAGPDAETAGEPRGSDPLFATRLATREPIPEEKQTVRRWRRRESNPGPQVLNDDFYTT